MRHHSPRATLLALALALVFPSGWAQSANDTVAGRAQAAYEAADAGYRFYGRGEFAAAVREARTAVQLAPQRRAYWLLLGQALVATGEVDAAADAIAQAALAAGDENELARLRADVATARAHSAGDAMFKALEGDDVAAAIRHGERAVQLEPANVVYRMGLANALLRGQRYEDAERIAGESAALLPADAASVVLRAYARQGAGKTDAAAADIDVALQRGAAGATSRQLRLVLADLALAQGRPDRAMELVEPLPADDAEAVSRREWVRQQLTTAPRTAFGLPVPGVDCTRGAQDRACAVIVGSAPVLPGHAAAEAGYAAMERKDYALALQHARLATRASPGQRTWKMLHVNAAVAAGDLPDAERVITAALADAPGTDASLLAQRAFIRHKLGQREAADADVKAVLASGQLPPTGAAAMLLAQDRQAEARRQLEAAAAKPDMDATERLNLAYLWIQAGDDAAALQAFAQVDAAGGLPPTALMDAGYTAMRANRDQQAVGYFDRAVRAQAAGTLPMEPQALYETRRTSAEVERTWGVIASATTRNGAGVQAGFGAVGGVGDARTTALGVEGYWRPWGYRNGRYVEAFARGFATVRAPEGQFTGHDSFEGAVGARWKPFTDHNVVLSMARVFGPNVNDAWLAQVGYSWDTGGDMRMDRKSWWTSHFGAEAGRYFGSRRHDSYAVASATVGRSFALGDSTAVTPHLFAGVEHRSDDPTARTSSGVGVGVNLRQWFRADATRGPRSYVDLTVQYRARVSGDNRLKGPYVAATLSF